MKNILKTAAVASLLSFSLMAPAAQLLPQQVPDRILNYGDYVIIRVASFNSTDGCTGPKNIAHLDISDSAGKAFYATLLTAKASGADLVIGVGGCVAYAGNQTPSVYRMTLY